MRLNKQSLRLKLITSSAAVPEVSFRLLNRAPKLAKTPTSPLPKKTDINKTT